MARRWIDVSYSSHDRLRVGEDAFFCFFYICDFGFKGPSRIWHLHAQIWDSGLV